jgi:hypothetical protein
MLTQTEQVQYIKEMAMDMAKGTPVDMEELARNLLATGITRAQFDQAVDLVSRQVLPAMQRIPDEHEVEIDRLRTEHANVKKAWIASRAKAEEALKAAQAQVSQGPPAALSNLLLRIGEIESSVSAVRIAESRVEAIFSAPYGAGEGNKGEGRGVYPRV